MTDLRVAPAPTPARAAWHSTRPLSFYESLLAATSATISFTANLEGPLDLVKLREAWGLLRQAHPVLTGKLVPNGAETHPGVSGFDLVLPTAPGKPEIRARGMAGAKLANTVAQDHEIAFVEVVPQDGQTLVSFAIHHGIADARLGYHYFSLLWSYYTDLVAGRTPHAEPYPVPKSPEMVLAERGLGETRQRWIARIEKASPAKLPQTGAPNLNPSRIRLPRETTAKLRDTARASGLSMHGLIVGTIAVAERRRLPLGDGGAVDLAIDSTVDIRGRIDPPVPLWSGTNMINLSGAVVAVHPESDPLSVGARILAQLAEDFESGVLYHGFQPYTDFHTKPRPKVPQTIATNLGVVEAIRTPPDLSVADLQIWVQHDGPVHATSDEGARTPPSALAYIVKTYEGQLSADINVPASAQGAQAFVKDLEKLFLQVADLAPQSPSYRKNPT